ncbi:hypothetical protein MTY66_09360 [Mycolicibacterium sp. TY66]|nr:hypothetical protein MTY66_09360 [Mycolicibacterium sp. TY66]BCJ83028.1 hypothetical protein MTY81_44010 [Mycolicibacterium sp. TY81]
MQIGVDDVGLHELESLVLLGLGEVVDLAAAQVVEPDDVVSFGQEPVDERRSDEPGSTSDKCSHGATIPTVAA